MFAKVKLKDVCEFTRGLTYSKKDEVSHSSNIVLRATNIKLKDNKLNLDELKYIRDDINIKEEKILKKGDILICTASGSKSHLGKVALIDKNIKMAFGGFMGVLRTSEKCLPQFLYTILTSQKFKNKLMSNTDGININNLKFSQIENFEFELPSISEQQQIVSNINVAFTEIDVINLHTARAITNTKKIFEKSLETLFNNKTYKEYELGSICEFSGGSQPPKSHFEYKSTKSNIRFIQIRDYKNNKYTVYIPREKTKKFCKTTDVMIGRYGPPLFQILRGIEGAYNVALMKAIPKKEVTNDYLFYFLKNKKIQDYVIKKSLRAAGQSGVNKATLEPYKINLPPITEQNKLVNKIKEIEKQSNILLSLYEKKLENIFKLKLSYLQNTFLKNKA